MIQHTLLIEDTPPSLNVIAGRGSRWAFSRAKKGWQSDIEVALMARAVPRGLARVEASAVLTFSTRRRRDEGNYRAVIEKALGDGLTNGGWLLDDTPDRYRFGRVEFAEGDAAKTAIHLCCWGAQRP